MLHFFKRQFMNLTIRRKIALGMVSLALITALVVGICCSASFVYLYTEQSNSQMDNTLDVTILSLKANLNSMYRNTTYMLSSTLLNGIYKTTVNGSRDTHFLKNYGLAQEYFNSYLRSNNLVDDVVLLCRGGDIYSTYEAGLNYSISQFSDELAQTNISWLHARTNPLLSGNTQVIPVCFPMSYQQGLFLSNGKKASMMLVAYLNVDRLALSMEQMNRTAFSRVYLSDLTGLPLSVKQSDQMYKKLADPSFRSRLASSKNRVHFVIDFDGEPYSVATQEVGVSGLRIVSIVSYSNMLQNVHKIQQVALAAVILSFLLALLIASGLSSTITTPIKNLLRQVDKMRGGNYALKPITKYNDEIHTLDDALCEMSQTVVEQMENIKRTEVLRRKAELIALTEQINPHFLYNTLDCIRWEILGGQQGIAAEMIESLGIFLRLSLNHGHDMLALPEVIEHTQQYISLMNYRFQSQIRFTYTISPELTRFMVPKMILQPLAENSITHGFGGQQLDLGVKDPTISVTARKQPNQVIITLEDNGRGIDTVRASESLVTPTEVNTHVGLHNVYHRLMYCFGPDVKIEFSSIPYYKNEVKLIMPCGDSGFEPAKSSES